MNMGYPGVLDMMTMGEMEMMVSRYSRGNSIDPNVAELGEDEWPTSSA